jgi:hypothetical protein
MQRGKNNLKEKALGKGTLGKGKAQQQNENA